MESLKLWEQELTPLTNLASRVEDFASRCLPDFVYTSEETRDLSFAEIEIGKHFGEEVPRLIVGLTMRDGEATVPHVFTRWSRSQLLSHVGTREKWFKMVTKFQEADELNRRLPVLDRFMLRTMRSFDDPSLRIVRGIVSSSYADIPDPDIMKALLEIMPGGFALRAYSGKTDRAFYAYAITADKIGIPGTSYSGFPGVVIKNSEVGFTSLWITPMLYVADLSAPVVMEKQVLLRRVHRGAFSEMLEKFNEALAKGKSLWGPLQAKLAQLDLLTFPTEDDAVSVLTTLMSELNAAQSFIFRCSQLYRAAHHVNHNGVHLFEAILAAVKESTDNDDAYVAASVAGAVLMRLIK